MDVLVIKDNVFIGILTENSQEISFKYVDEINSEQYLAGLSDKINTSQVLFPIFENLLPETAQLELIKHTYQIKNQIDVLLHLNNIQGSFEFYRRGILADLNLKQPNSQNFIYTAIHDKVLENSYTFPNILQNYTINITEKKLKGTAKNSLLGLSGVQNKLGVSKNDNLKTIDTNDKSGEYLFKPENTYHSEYKPDDIDHIYVPYLLINEHLFMTLARDFGFDVPYNAIIVGNNCHHYIIKRYDRYNDIKISNIELLQLMNKQSEDKYDISIENVIQTVLPILNASDMLQLFRFIVFSLIISHGDLHAKNISLIKKSSLSKREDKLAPFYDISTTKIYDKYKNEDIGMSINGKKRKISTTDLLLLAELMKIDKTTAILEIENISSKFITTFLQYIEKLPTNIQLLPIIVNRYKKFKIFSVVMREYYDNRCKYIKTYLQEEKLAANNSIWD